MIDPRNDIVGLFTNSRVSGSSDHGTKYVKVDLREDNENAEITGKDLGALILESPVVSPSNISVNGKTYEESITQICNLWIRKHVSLKNPDSFINNIVNSFQNTIVDNHLSLSSVGDIWLGDVLPVASQSSEVYRRSLLLHATGYKIRT